MLSDEELGLLEDELVSFLIVNGLTKDEWVKLNEVNPEKALDVIGIFSDTILQKVYERVRFIEHRSRKNCLVFRLGNDQIDLISLSLLDDNLDLSSPDSIHDVLVNHPSKLRIFSASKQYSGNREKEIHQMLEDGCVNSSESFWLSLENLINQQP